MIGSGLLMVNRDAAELMCTQVKTRCGTMQQPTDRHEFHKRLSVNQSHFRANPILLRVLNTCLTHTCSSHPNSHFRGNSYRSPFDDCLGTINYPAYLAICVPYGSCSVAIRQKFDGGLRGSHLTSSENSSRAFPKIQQNPPLQLSHHMIRL